MHIFLTVRLKFHIFIMRWSKFSRSWCGWLDAVAANKRNIVAREARKKLSKIFEASWFTIANKSRRLSDFPRRGDAVAEKSETVLNFCEHTAPIIAQLAGFGSNCANLTSVDSRRGNIREVDSSGLLIACLRKQSEQFLANFAQFAIRVAANVISATFSCITERRDGLSPRRKVFGREILVPILTWDVSVAP